MRCLVVEDEPDIARFVGHILTDLNGIVDTVGTLSDAQQALRSFTYDLVVLDRGLPDGDALDLLDQLNGGDHRPGTIVLTAMDTKEDVVSGLNAGADDYLVKPFEPQELVARARAVLRRPRASLPGSLTFGNMTLVAGTSELTVAGSELLLRRREAVILETLLLRPERVVPRNVLIEAVYGFNDEIESNSLDAQVSRIRKRMSDAGSSCEIRSVRGIGYILRSLSAR